MVFFLETIHDISCYFASLPGSKVACQSLAIKLELVTFAPKVKIHYSLNIATICVSMTYEYVERKKLNLEISWNLVLQTRIIHIKNHKSLLYCRPTCKIIVIGVFLWIDQEQTMESIEFSFIQVYCLFFV